MGGLPLSSDGGQWNTPDSVEHIKKNCTSHIYVVGMYPLFVMKKRKRKEAEEKKTYTITFGDVAENHVGMEKIGELHHRGYSLETLEKVRSRLEGEGVECEMISLHTALEEEEEEKVEEAYVLVIRRGVQHILKTEDTREMMEENDKLKMDKHALMRGRVVNKHARWNLCFADEEQEPEYEKGKGRIVSWKHIPLVSRIRQVISEWTSSDELLNGEANYYYDIEKCGIGYHGDGERKKVFAVRMGASMPLYFQWYKYSKAIGFRIKVELGDGDMYMMSEKAVGFDWLKRNVATLRHATGCEKYTRNPVQ